MRCWAFLLTAPWWDAAVEFAVSLNLPSLFTRFGVDAQGNILIAANPGSCTLPTVKPLYGCGPTWIGKLDSSGHTLLVAPSLAHAVAAGRWRYLHRARASCGSHD